MTYCTHCGQQNSARANFCSQCGSPLAKPEKPAAQPGESAPQGSRSGDTTRMLSATPDESRENEGLSLDDEAAIQALPAGSALLIVRRGANAGSRFLLNVESTTVGRSQSADIILDDISVSRRHAVFTRGDAGMNVADVGSLNGTYVNQKLIDQQQLQFGDEVQIGKFRLVFYNAPS